MRLALGVRVRLGSADLDPEAVGVVLKRLESAVPHLHFEAWRAGGGSASDAPAGRASWFGSDNRQITIEVFLSGLRIWTRCARDVVAINRDDREFLEALADEAARAVNSGVDGAVQVVDFGAAAVASEIYRLRDLEYDPLPVLQFIRSLSQETYEGQRISYGLILGGGETGTASFVTAFENKRFKNMTDGFSTALALDRHGRVAALLPLKTPDSEGTSRQKRPWWAAGLAVAAKQRHGIGLALTRNGDLLVLQGGRLLFSQRAGTWRKWDHTEIESRLCGLFDFQGQPGHVETVLGYLYHVAIDLSFKRSGGLLVVLASRERLGRLLTSKADIIGSSKRREPEISLDSSLSARKVYRTDRRVIADLASLDGAVVVDRNGGLLAYGAMTQTSGRNSQGARTRAAYAASAHGVAIKVSSDGGIGFFQGRKLHLEI